MDDDEGFLYYIDPNGELFGHFNKKEYIGPVTPDTYHEYQEYLRCVAEEKANKSKSKILTTHIGRLRSRSPITVTKNNMSGEDNVDCRHLTEKRNVTE